MYLCVCPLWPCVCPLWPCVCVCECAWGTVNKCGLLTVIISYCHPPAVFSILIPPSLWGTAVSSGLTLFLSVSLKSWWCQTERTRDRDVFACSDGCVHLLIVYLSWFVWWALPVTVHIYEAHPYGVKDIRSSGRWRAGVETERTEKGEADTR